MGLGSHKEISIYVKDDCLIFKYSVNNDEDMGELVLTASYDELDYVPFVEINMELDNLIGDVNDNFYRGVIPGLVVRTKSGTDEKEFVVEDAHLQVKVFANLNFTKQDEMALEEYLRKAQAHVAALYLTRISRGILQTLSVDQAVECVKLACINQVLKS